MLGHDWLHEVFKKPTVPKQDCKFLFFHGTWKLIAVFARAHQPTYTWPSWDQFIPTNPLSLRLVVISFPPYMWINLPNGSIFPSVFSTKTLHLSIVLATHWAHHRIFDEAYKLWSSSSCRSFHPAVTSFPLRFEYSLTADAGFVCDAAHGTAAMLGDVMWDAVYFEILDCRTECTVLTGMENFWSLLHSLKWISICYWHVIDIYAMVKKKPL